MILYAATSNSGKLREFTLSAAQQNIEVLPLPGLKEIPEPIEGAPTFMGNAELKARAYSLNLPAALVFADDSGLEVPALANEPGVRSARYADDAGCDLHSGATRDARNNALLLDRLSENPARPEFGRQAHFVCALALARDGQILLRAKGTVEGEILHTPRGSSGFGYDPLFLIPHLGQTMAELDPAQKWKLSHRGRAFRSLLAQLQSLNLSS